MGYPDAASVMDGWMNSPGHRANILSGNVTEIGVGLAYAADGTPYWTMVLAVPADAPRTPARHPSVGSAGCRASARDGHRRSARRRHAPAAAPAPSIVGSWVDGTLHLWGWDGAHTALPNALHRAFDEPRWARREPVRHRPPLLARRRAARRRARCARPSVRLPADRAARWLRAIPAGATTQRLASRWLAAVARLAAVDRRGRARRAAHPHRPGHAGRPLGARRRPRGRRGARRAGRGDAADLPAGAGRPDDRRRHPRRDGRRRRPPSPRRPRVEAAAAEQPRTPAMMAARSVFRALAAPDPLIGGSGARPPRRAGRAWPPASTATRRRLRGEPVVLPRVRLVVPDDPYDDWEVRLELVDELDPGRWCSAEDVWDDTPVAVEVAGGAEHVAALAAEVSALAATRRRVRRRRRRPGPRARAGRPRARPSRTPSGSSSRRRPSWRRWASSSSGPSASCGPGSPSRGRATPHDSPDHPKRFGREAVVDWQLVVADDDGPAAITDAELERAERAGATLLHTGRRWVRIDPAAHAPGAQAARGPRSASTPSSTPSRCCGWPATGELDAREAPTRRRRAAVDRRAARRPARRAAAARSTSRTGSSASCGRTSAAASAWLRFLERLGLGGLPRRRHGPRQDGHDARPPPRPARPAPRRLPAVGRAQLAGRGRPLRAGAARRRPPRRRARRDRSSPAPTSSSRRTACCRATSSTSGAVEWSTVVADEAQIIKNPATHAAKALRALRAGQKLALTGTPVENRLAELWAILDAVNPGMLGSRERFRHRFAKPIERDGDGDAAARLRRITQPFVLRRTKADRSLVPDLPDKIEQVAWAGLTREQAVLYQHVVDQLLADAAAATGMKRRGLVLAALTRLKQICNHPAHVLGDGSRPRRALGQAGPLRRARRRAARRRRAGARVHAVPRDGRAARAPRRRAARAARAVPARRRVAGPPRRDGRRLPGRRSGRRCCSCR